MKLNEWHYINNTTPSTKAPSKYFVNRFEKLMDYYAQHLPASVKALDAVSIESDPILQEDTLWFRELHYSGDKIDYRIKMDTETSHWTIRFCTNENPYRTLFTGDGWPEFLKAMRQLITVPVTGTPEYKNLLTEWVAMKGNQNTASTSTTAHASSKTNKEKFTDLVGYMQKHKDSSTIFTSVNGPNDTGFEYEEQRVLANGREYNLSVEVSLGKHNLFTIHVDKDGKRIDNIMANGWEELLKYLKIYFNVPYYGSTEHKSICESATSSIAEDFRLYENLWN